MLIQESKLRRNTGGLVQIVAMAIDSDILEERMTPGHFLGREIDLMSRYGVSRPTLRIAVRKLEAADRVMTRPGPHGGIYVKSVSAKAVMALARHIAMLGQPMEVFYAFYSPLCAMIAARAARFASPSARQRLAEMRDQMNSEPDILSAFRRSRARIREVIFGAAGDPILSLAGAAFQEAYLEILRDELRLGATEQAKIARVKAAEDAIIAAILAGDPVATAAAYRHEVEVEMACTRETILSGMIPERAVPRTLFATGEAKQTRKLAEHVARALRCQIDLLQGPVGTSFGTVDNLALQLGVSYEVCREALLLLLEHGLVSLRRGRRGGVYIGKLSLAAIAPVLEADFLAAAGPMRDFTALHGCLADTREEIASGRWDAAAIEPTMDLLNDFLRLIDTWRGAAGRPKAVLPQ